MKKHCPSLLLSAGAGLVLAGGLVIWMNLCLRPLMLSAAEARLTRMVTWSVGSLWDETSDGSPIELHYDDSGQLTAVILSTDQANRLNRRLLRKLSADLDSAQRFSVPIGSLTGLPLLSGRGFGIPVEVAGISGVESRLDSTLTSAGINQTLHRVNLVVRVELVLLLIGGTDICSVTAEIPVAEGVFLGQVPENYTYFSQFDSAREASDAYFDYGSDE